MDMEQLVDITKCAVGAVNIARAESATVGTRRRRVPSNAGVAVSAQYIDTVLTEIIARITAQDPLALPTILALSGAQSVIVGGRLVNGETYRDYTMSRGILTGFSMEIADAAHGSLTLDIQNRAAAESTDVGDELAVASGTRQSIVTRRPTIRIGADAAFVDDDESDFTMPGIERVSYQVQPLDLYVASSNPASGNVVHLADIVDVSAYQISGAVTLRDTSISSALSLGEVLAAAPRGTLVLPCLLSGASDEPTAPARKIITLERIKFHDCTTSLRSKSPGAQDLAFDAIAISAEGTALTLAQMIAMEDESAD